MNDLEVSEKQNSERLEQIEEYKNLTEIQKRILFIHNDDPSLTQKEIAKEANCHWRTVFDFYHSKAFDRLTTEIGNIKKTELILPALQTLEMCLKSKSEQVRLMAARAILGDAGIIKDQPRIDNSKKAIILTWKKEENGADNTILPTGLSETGS